MEDKEAIETVAREIHKIDIKLAKLRDKKESCEDYTYVIWEYLPTITQTWYKSQAKLIIQTLASLGYVKLAEQKLPENTYVTPLKQVAYMQTQQDMLSVDAGGCAYRRVRIRKEKVK
jgi:hypothetical protein